ncbi:MAG: homoserine O-acetyltransferase [Brachybacterium sp.]|nr:homoserine O-acetyltransferase [Brachybacterium sp.]
MPDRDPPAPASGAWRASHGAGHRRFADIGPLALECGEVLENVTVAYESWGSLDPDAGNAVLVLHALTGDSHVTGEAGPGHPTPGWWPEMVGPGKPIDTDRFCVIAPNVLGGCQGTTGPSSPAPDSRPWGSRFPALTLRDQVAAEAALADVLGIDAFALVIGGSMGGMRALEWATGLPDRVQRLAVIAGGARATGDQIAWNSAQIAAITGSPGFHGGDYYEVADGDGPHEGLGVARRIAHITYRCPAELDARFANRPQTGEDPVGRGGRHQVTSYLDHHAAKLVRRFDANSYLVLVRAMNTHDVGRARGGTTAALGQVTAISLIVGIDSDRLFPAGDCQEIAEAIPGGMSRTLSSDIGHDGFLVPAADLAAWVRDLLSRPAGVARGTRGALSPAQWSP